MSKDKKPDSLKLWTEDDVIDSNLRRREDEQLVRRPIEQQTFISKEDFVRVLDKWKKALMNTTDIEAKTIILLDMEQINEQITKKPKEG